MRDTKGECANIDGHTMFGDKPKYIDAHEQGEHHDALPMDAAGSVNLFEYGVAKSNAQH